MTQPADEFVRRFLLHVLPDGFPRILHYGLFASAVRAANIDWIRAPFRRPAGARLAGGSPACRGEAARGHAALPVLRRHHDHHRDLRPWLGAQDLPRECIHQDRHLMSGATSLGRQLHPAGRVASAKDSVVLAPSFPRAVSSWDPAAHLSTGAASTTALSRTVGCSVHHPRQDHPAPSTDPKSPWHRDDLDRRPRPTTASSPGLSDAGPRDKTHRPDWAGIRNPSQERTWRFASKQTLEDHARMA